jgi:hypothetical protein
VPQLSELLVQCDQPQVDRRVEYVAATVVEHEQETTRQPGERRCSADQAIELPRDRPYVRPASRHARQRRHQDVPRPVVDPAGQEPGLLDRVDDRRRKLAARRQRERPHLHVGT